MFGWKRCLVRVVHARVDQRVLVLVSLLGGRSGPEAERHRLRTHSAAGLRDRSTYMRPGVRSKFGFCEG